LRRSISNDQGKHYLDNINKLTIKFLMFKFLFANGFAILGCSNINIKVQYVKHYKLLNLKIW